MLPEPLVSTADQTKRGLWGRECPRSRYLSERAQWEYEAHSRN